MTNVRLQHNSMQFSDDAASHRHDAKAVFDKATDTNCWAITGTEAGGSRRNHELHDFLIEEAQSHGWFGYFSKNGEWVALNRKFMYRFDHGYAGPYIPGTQHRDAAHGGHSPRGIAWCSGEAKAEKLGVITVGVAHYLTKASIKVSGSNQRLVNGIGKWGRDHGGGSKIVFFNADANERDNLVDVFHGKPFTTIADELHKHPKTHGTTTERGTAIDIIASYDLDTRVKGKSYKVFDDSDVQLRSDHFLLQAVYEVAPLSVKK